MNRGKDFSLIIGIVVGIILVIFSIGVGDLRHFLNISSAVVVIGGTLAALSASVPFRFLKQVPKQLVIAIQDVPMDPYAYIDELVEIAHKARKEGLLSLEDRVREQEDIFMRNCLLLLLDAVSSDKARHIMESEVEHLDDRHQDAITFFEKGAAYAPAFGLVGTLIGLILMLASLDLDSTDGVATLTNGMAVALITTFYGCLLGNLIFAPIASKLTTKNSKEMLCKRIIVEGVLSIQAGENPKFIREVLVSYLPYLSRKEEDKKI